MSKLTAYMYEPFFFQLDPKQPEPQPPLIRGDERLRHRRSSQRGAVYFLTLCTRDRTPGLHHAEVGAALRGEISACEHDGHWCVSAGVIMPDHVHLLAELMGEIALSRVVARVKAKTKSVLLKSGVEWQGNFYEHRLRVDDPREAVIRYIISNPQRAGLVRADEVYVGAWMHPEVQQWFSSLLDDGRPFPEWLM